MIGTQFATRSEVEALRRKLERVISGAGIVQHGSDTDIAENFIDLADVPQSYSGCAGEIVAVNSAEDELHFNPYVTVAETSPTLTVRNMTDSSVDPIVQFSLGASPVIKFTAGIDDSNDDWFMICSGDTLGNPRYIALGNVMVLNSWDDPPDGTRGQNIYLSRYKVRIHAAYDSDTPTPGEIDIEAGSSISTPGKIYLKAEEINIDPRAELRFYETGDDGVGYIGFKAPAVIASSLIWTLPDADSVGTQALVSDGSGALGWLQPVVDARIDDAINSGDATTDGVIDAIRDAMISLGFMAAA